MNEQRSALEPSGRDTRGPWSRRALLTGVAGGVAAWVASAFGRATPAWAANDETVTVGGSFEGTDTTKITVTDESKSAIWGSASATTGTGVGVRGDSAARDGMGILGRTTDGFGVRGVANDFGVGVSGFNVGGGDGVRAESASGTGLGATGRTGVAGRGGDVGVQGSSWSGIGVEGVRSAPSPAIGFGGSGVRGENKNGDGVHGIGGGGGTGVVGDGKFGILGRSSDAGGFGVWRQHFTTGPAVLGHSLNGYGGQFEGGKAQLRLVPKGSTGRPASGAHNKGELYLDSAGALFICVRSGSPGRWRKFTTTTA